MTGEKKAETQRCLLFTLAMMCSDVKGILNGQTVATLYF